MKYLKLLSTLLIMALLCVPSFASDDKNAPAPGQFINHAVKASRAHEILIQAMSGNGFMNPEIHKEFWSYMPERSHDPNDPLMVKMRQFVKNCSPAYQKEVFFCAQESYKKRMVVKTDSLIKLQKSSKEQALTAYESKKGTPAYDSFLKAIDRGINQADNLLVASATHSTWDTPELGPIPITMEYLIEHQKNYDEAFERVNILLDPTYYNK